MQFKLTLLGQTGKKVVGILKKNVTSVRKREGKSDYANLMLNKKTRCFNRDNSCKQKLKKNWKNQRKFKFEIEKPLENNLNG